MRLKSTQFVWLAVAATVVIAVSLGLHIGLPFYLRHSAMHALPGRLEVIDGTPQWLSRFAGVESPSAFGIVARADFKDAQIQDADLRHLCHLTEIESITLDYSSITDAGLLYLAGLRSLKHLSLRGTPITDAGIAHLRGLEALETLSIRSTNVTDAGLEQLGKLPNLKSVLVGMSETTPEGRARFRRAHPSISVEW